MKHNKEEKEKILIAADKLFRESGLYKTSMDELAALLQISKKTIYKYFTSKENLVKEIIKNRQMASTKRIDKIIRSKTDVVTKFVNILNDYSCEFSNVSEKSIKDFQVHYPEVWKSVEQFRSEKIIFYAKKLFKQGFKEKYISNIPVEIVIASYSASVMSVANPTFLIENNFSMSEALKYVYEMELNGILTEKGRKKYYSQKKNHIK